MTSAWCEGYSHDQLALPFLYSRLVYVREQVVTIAFDSVRPVLERRARQERLLHRSSCSMTRAGSAEVLQECLHPPQVWKQALGEEKKVSLEGGSGKAVDVCHKTGNSQRLK